ncbi:MAG TPA: DUF2865 domain-containing protein, partial [Beijerinckiaceae bacterium]|nr:DUF2865 domain-containing protein [Beijerinckiaceae bacterium]
ARAEDGQRYTALPNAFQYRKAYDPSCSCKQPQQSWASALRDADKLVRDRANDITVTEERSNQMARPQQVRLRGVKGKTAPEEPVEMQLNTNFATNSTATAGIGPAVSGNRMLGTGDGETREVNSKGGEKKQVRVLTPALSLSQ